MLKIVREKTYSMIKSMDWLFEYASPSDFENEEFVKHLQATIIEWKKGHKVN